MAKRIHLGSAAGNDLEGETGKAKLNMMHTRQETIKVKTKHSGPMTQGP